jgi:hypothetical protein
MDDVYSDDSDWEKSVDGSFDGDMEGRLSELERKIQSIIDWKNQTL